MAANDPISMMRAATPASVPAEMVGSGHPRALSTAHATTNREPVRHDRGPSTLDHDSYDHEPRPSVPTRRSAPVGAFEDLGPMETLDLSDPSDQTPQVTESRGAGAVAIIVAKALFLSLPAAIVGAAVGALYGCIHGLFYDHFFDQDHGERRTYGPNQFKQDDLPHPISALAGMVSGFFHGIVTGATLPFYGLDALSDFRDDMKWHRCVSRSQQPSEIERIYHRG